MEGGGPGLHISDTAWYRNAIIMILSSTGIVVTENSQGRRGRPANEALGQTIIDAARELFVELGFQATTLDKVAQRAKISKLSIYRHFENKEALFGAAMAAGCHQLFAPQALLEGVDGSVEDQLVAVGSSLLRTLLRSDVRTLEAMVMADKTSQNALSKLHFEAGPAQVIAEIEAPVTSVAREGGSERARSSPVRPLVRRAFQRIRSPDDRTLRSGESRGRQRNRILLPVGRRHVHRRAPFQRPRGRRFACPK